MDFTQLKNQQRDIPPPQKKGKSYWLDFSGQVLNEQSFNSQNPIAF